MSNPDVLDIIRGRVGYSATYRNVILNVDNKFNYFLFKGHFEKAAKNSTAMFHFFYPSVSSILICIERHQS